MFSFLTIKHCPQGDIGLGQRNPENRRLGIINPLLCVGIKVYKWFIKAGLGWHALNSTDNYMTQADFVVATFQNSKVRLMLIIKKGPELISNRLL